MSHLKMKKERNMTRAFRIAALALASAASLLAGVPAFAGDTPAALASTALAGSGRPMTLELNKSQLIELPRDVAEVVISNPAVVEAVVRTPRRVHLLGQQIGQTSAVFVGRDGARLLSLDIDVERDLAPVAAAIRRLVPTANVKLEAVNDNIVLTGTAPSALDASRVVDIAGRFTAKREQILNMLNVEAKEQVLLRVTVAEINRSAIRRLGVDVREALVSGNIAVAKVVENSFPVTGGLVAGSFVDSTNALIGAAAGTTAAATWSNGKSQIGAVVDMLERNGLARTLAEPNLTSISGETADFLAGGEYPVPVASEKDTTTIAFKPFGVKLAFTPVVLSEGRISLKVATEVSELTNEGAVTVNAISIPALRVRRASSTLELPSGGSLVMAGLISSQTRKNVEGVPGIRDLPVLGTLFRSDDFLRSESEMVVIVTPYLVGTAARHDLRLPGDAAAPDPGRESVKDGVFLSSAQAGAEGAEDSGFGFIIE
jgi:pilus assembly protein CpaC